jgi:hypothetical protein
MNEGRGTLASRRFFALVTHDSLLGSPFFRAKAGVSAGKDETNAACDLDLQCYMWRNSY